MSARAADGSSALGVAVRAWALWTAGGVVLGGAPVAGEGPRLAPWPDGPPPRSSVRARPLPPAAEALVRLADALAGGHPPADTDVCLGTVAGSRAEDLAFLAQVAARGPAFGSPGTFVHTLSTAPLAEMALALGLRGALRTVTAGTASAAVALATAAAALVSGRSTRVLAGAVDVAGGPSDVVALLLLERAVPGDMAPALLAWETGFGGAGDGAAAGSLRPSVEAVVAALAGVGAPVVEVRCPTGHGARLRLRPKGGA